MAITPQVDHEASDFVKERDHFRMNFGVHSEKSYFNVLVSDFGYIRWATTQTNPGKQLANFLTYAVHRTLNFKELRSKFPLTSLPGFVDFQARTTATSGTTSGAASSGTTSGTTTTAVTGATSSATSTAGQVMHVFRIMPDGSVAQTQPLHLPLLPPPSTQRTSATQALPETSATSATPGTTTSATATSISPSLRADSKMLPRLIQADKALLPENAFMDFDWGILGLPGLPVANEPQVDCWRRHFSYNGGRTAENPELMNFKDSLRDRLYSSTSTIQVGDYNQDSMLTSCWYYCILTSTEYNELKSTGTSVRQHYTHWNFSETLYDAIHYYFWSGRSTTTEDYVTRCGSTSEHFIICMRMDYQAFFHRSVNYGIHNFNRRYQDFHLVLHNPLITSPKENFAMQVGLLTFERATYFETINSGYFLRIFHVVRHVTEYLPDEHFLVQLQCDRDELMNFEEEP